DDLLPSLVIRFMKSPSKMAFSDRPMYGYLMKADDDCLLRALTALLAALEGRRTLIRSDSHRIDGLIRCWMLTRRIAGESYDVKSFMEYAEAFTLKITPKQSNDIPQKQRARGRVAGSGQPAKPESVSRGHEFCAASA